MGIGWNEAEFVALGENFANRGVRSEEQVEVMKALWSKPYVLFEGKWHHIPNAGINPLPTRKPLPVSPAAQCSGIQPSPKRAMRFKTGSAAPPNHIGMGL